MFEASKNYLIVIMATFIVVLVLGLVGMKQSLNDKNSKIEELKISVAEKDLTNRSLVANSKSKDDLIVIFETRFKELKDLEVIRAKKVEEALKAIEEKAAKSVSLSNRILASTPQSDDLCVEANNLINAYLNDIQGVKP